MGFCLSEGSKGPEIGLLIDNLRGLGLEVSRGTDFTPEVSGALKMFQQSHHDHTGTPLKIDGRLWACTAHAIDCALSKSRKAAFFKEFDLPQMSLGGSIIARQAALVAHGEYLRACGEQGGNNLGPDVGLYHSDFTRMGKAWSCSFATWCFAEAGTPEDDKLGRPHDAQTLMEIARSKNYDVTDIGEGLLPGDLVVWYFNEPSLRTHPNWGGHVGIVWSYQDGNIITLEGDRGRYPSLVRPYRHKHSTLCQRPTAHQLRDGIGIIRVP